MIKVRYAIGELLIVITGITIAFALNNWWQGRQREDLREEYLQSLRDDLMRDTTSLGKLQREAQSRLQFLRQRMIPGMHGGQGDQAVLAREFFNIIDPLSFYPYDATIESLRFTGDFQLLRSVELRTEILSHYASYKKVEMEQKRMYDFARNYMADYFLINLKNEELQDGGKPAFLQDPYFRNITYSYNGMYALFEAAVEDAHRSATDLLAALD